MTKAYFKEQEKPEYRLIQNMHEICNEALHYIYLYRNLNSLSPKDTNRTLEILNYNAYYEGAIRRWCMIFGSYSEESHYRNLLKLNNIKKKLSQIFNIEKGNIESIVKDKIIISSGLPKQEYAIYHKSVIKYRNKFLIHKESFPEKDKNFKSVHPHLEPMINTFICFILILTSILKAYNDNRKDRIYYIEFREAIDETEVKNIYGEFINSLK